jgi:hypothetical protein
MKNKISITIIAALCVFFSASASFSYTAGNWSGKIGSQQIGYTITSVRQNGTLFIFQVQPIDLATSGTTIADNVATWFGFQTTNTPLTPNAMISIILAAKTSGRTINFCTDSTTLVSGIVTIYAVDIN